MMDASLTKTKYLTAADIDTAFDQAGGHVDARVRVAAALEAAVLTHVAGKATAGPGTERPILFTAPMIRALLAGTKTQTRRLVKPCRDKMYGCELAPHEIAGEVNNGDFRNCPYGEPGDRLWVREAFQPLLAEGVDWTDASWKTGAGYSIGYPATDGVQEYRDMDDNLGHACKPSIHMPRWASRITLAITHVRIEHLQDITEADAKAEGCAPAWLDAEDNTTVHVHAPPTYRRGYARQWREINGDESWGRNPRVWVIEFTRVEVAKP